LLEIVVILTVIFAPVSAIGFVDPVINALCVLVADLGAVNRAFGFGAADAGQRCNKHQARREW